MKDKKIVFVISLVERSLAFEWFFSELIKTLPDIEIIFLNPVKPPLAIYCESVSIKTHWIGYDGKRNFFSSLIKVWKIIINKRIDIVHCHLFDASLIGIIAARLAGIKRRIHTRHHASQHHLYNPHAVKYDRLINRNSSHIVAISEGIKKILIEKENVEVQKISVVHHGFNLSYFENVNVDRINKLKEKYNLKNVFPVIGVISRWTHWKGIQYILPAFKKLREKYADAVLLLANAKGEYSNEIKNLLSDFTSSEFRAIEFENDIPALYHSMNVFVHTPIDDHSEAFGQVYVEALAAGVPSVFTLSGVANEFIRDHYNALVVPWRDADAIEKAIREILADETLAKKINENGKRSVTEHFDISAMVEKMKAVYER